MLTYLVRILKSDWTRLASGALAYSAMAIFLWPPEIPEGLSTLDIALLIGAVASLASWVATEVVQFTPTLSDHDRDLYRQIRQKITEGHVQFLKTYDMGGGAFRSSFVDPYPEVVHTWLGARWEFNDPALLKKWRLVLAKMNKFSVEIGRRLHADDRNMDLLKVEKSQRHTDEGRARFDADREALNNAATELAEELDNFERAILPRLAGSTPSPS